MAGDGHSSSSKHKRELFGWLSYAFASEVFVIVSLTLFLPICLEQFARDNGFLLPDKTIPCSSRPSPPAGVTDEDDVRCVVKLGWAWIDTASFRCVCSGYSVRSSLTPWQPLHIFTLCCTASVDCHIYGRNRRQGCASIPPNTLLY